MKNKVQKFEIHPSKKNIVRLSPRIGIALIDFIFMKNHFQFRL